MRKIQTAVILTVSLSLSACQTLDGINVNGVRLGVKEAQGDSFCERNMTLCVIGGLAAVGGGVALATGGYSKKSYTSPGTGTPGTGTPGPGKPGMGTGPGY